MHSANAVLFNALRLRAPAMWASDVPTVDFQLESVISSEAIILKKLIGNMKDIKVGHMC